MKRHLLPTAVFPVWIIALLLATCTEDKRCNILDSGAGNCYEKDSVLLIEKWAPECNRNAQECLKQAHENKELKDNLFSLTIDNYDSSKNQVTAVSPAIWLKGTLKIEGDEKLDHFLVNTQSVEVAKNGAWKTILYLKEKDNQVKVYAEDTSGNAYRKTLKVYYDKNAPDTAGPIILVTTLKSGDTVSTKFPMLTGLILDKSAIIDSEFTIDDKPVRVAGNNWSKNVLLKKCGRNVLALAATDTKNNKTSFEFIIECSCTDSNSLDASNDTDFTGPEVVWRSPIPGSALENFDVEIRLKVTDPSGVAHVELLHGDSVQTLQLEGDSLYIGNAILDSVERTELTIKARDKSFHKNDSRNKANFFPDLPDTTAPVVIWVSPPLKTGTNTAETKTAEIEVKVQVIDDISGIDPSDPEALRIKVGERDEENMEWENSFYVKKVKLDKGKNTIVIIAKDKDTNEAWPDFQITYSPESP